ncbi:hypothetical protein OROMI_007542 [Orobanche minor]
MNIDLNQPPTENEFLTDGEILVNEKETSILATPSSSENIIIDAVHDNSEIRNPVIELDLSRLSEDIDGSLSDSSIEQIHHQIEDNGHGHQEWGRKRRVLTDVAIYQALLEKSVKGKLKKTTTKEVQEMFNVHNLRTIQRIWRMHKTTPPGMKVDVSSRKARNCGRKRIEIDLTRVQQIELHQRTTLTSFSSALGVSCPTLYRLFKKGVLRRRSSSIKPHLKEENKISRMEFCLSMLDENTTPNDPKFKGMYNYVHIDEKWFYLTKKDHTYYLLDNEDDPYRSCQSKNFIGKVMFLVATARPRFDDEGIMIFSGKIGCWPFITEQPAQRNSRNRQAGTMEMKAITCVKRETIKVFLIEKVIPAVRERWPRLGRGETIFIQQDNARTHVLPNDPNFLEAASQNGFDIRLTCQPPNSPDLNVLDLGFFRAIQSLQQKMRARTIPELVHAVEKAYDDYPPIKLNYVWLTLQLCMKEIMKIGGGNRYKIPHINKNRLQMLGRLPTQISCDPVLLQVTKDSLATRMGIGSSGAAEEEA